MKKIALVFIILLSLGLLLASPALADEMTTILDTWVASEHAFSHEGYEYSLVAPEAYNQDEGNNFLIIEKNGVKTIVEYNSCKQTSTYEYCYVNTSYDEDGVGLDSNRKIQPAIYVTIKEVIIESGLTLSRTVPKSGFTIGEETTITIDLLTSDESSYTNILISERVPEGFTVTKSNGFTVNGKTLSATIELDDNADWQGSYTIKAQEEATSTTQTRITYTMGVYKDLSLTSAKATFEITAAPAATQAQTQTEDIEVEENVTAEEPITDTVVEEATTIVEIPPEELPTEETAVEEEITPTIIPIEQEEVPKGFFAKLAKILKDIF